MHGQPHIRFTMRVCTCLWYHCIYLGMFLSIFVVIAVADLTKFLHDMMLCCKYQQFIVNKYLWIQKKKLKIGINIQIFIFWLVTIAQLVQGLTAGRIIIVLLLAAICYWQQGISLTFLLHPDQLWYLSVCLRQIVGTLPLGRVVADYMSGWCGIPECVKLYISSVSMLSYIAA